MLHVWHLKSLMCGEPLNECECDCPALQAHSFTIGTELMKSVEEEVNFDGHFYTFSGFNVSIFATCLSSRLQM